MQKFHPMVQVLFHCNLLSPEQLSIIPRTTKHNWSKFRHDDYQGYYIVEPYIHNLNSIKEMHTKKILRSAIKVACLISYGYKDLIAEIESNTSLFHKHAEKITYSITQISTYSNITITRACHLFGVSKDWFYRHRSKKTCNKSMLKKCFQQYPNQLPLTSVQQIERLISDPKNLGKTKTTLYYKAMRENKLTCALSTFFKYANLLGYQKLPPRIKEKRVLGFRASRIYEWLHVDVTLIQTQHDGVQRVAFVKDNFSKAILHYKSTDGKADSHFIRSLFQETFQKHGLFDVPHPIHILSDGGSENKGALLDWIDGLVTPSVVRKVTAKSSDFHFSNSMSESIHSIYKTEFMRRQYSFDLNQHLKDLKRFIFYYNEERFPSDHYGLTPKEVLENQLPNKHRFKERIKLAGVERIEKNKAFNACPITCPDSYLFVGS